jgi:tRNA wybutosine-synthesizing protein 3
MNPALGKNQFPMVAIRSNGLAMDAIIGVLDEEGTRPVQKLVTDSYIAMLVRVSNMRLIENARRIDKLTADLEKALFIEKNDRREGWESTEARRARKRAEGLKRQVEGRLAASTTELFGSGLACK